MIHYNIDTTENVYCNLEGDVELLIESKQILLIDDEVPEFQRVSKHPHLD